jgi:hypothetical protein
MAEHVNPFMSGFLEGLPGCPHLGFSGLACLYSVWNLVGLIALA